MAGTLGDRLRGLLASDVYSSKGRLRADDLLVRETDLAEIAELDAVDAAAVEGRLRRIRDVIGERRRYMEIQA